MATALTVYLTTTASATLSTSNQLLANASTGGALTNKNSNLTSGTTGWFELWSQGNASAQTGAGSEPSPSGRGWFLDSTLLEANQIASGNWTATIQLETTTTGSFIADLHARAYQYSSGTYTLIAEMVLASQTVVSTAFTTYTISATSVAASNVFAVGDKLYIDLPESLTNNGTTGNIRLEESSSATLGNVNAQIVTPGYQAITNNSMSSTDSLTVSDIGAIQTWNVDALSTADTALYIDSDSSIDALSSADAALFTVQDLASDGLAVAGTALYVRSDIPLEALNVSDSITVTAQISAADSLTIADTPLYTETSIPLEALTANDAMLSLLASSFIDTQPASDSLARSDGYVALEALNVSDVTSATDGTTFVDAGSASDFGNMQAWNIDALSASDALQALDTGNFTDSNIASDSFAQSDSYAATDAQSIADSFAQSETFQPIDAQPVTDLSSVLRSWLIDALQAIDAFTQSDSYTATEPLTSIENFAASENYVANEPLTATDTQLVIDGYTITSTGSSTDFVLPLSSSSDLMLPMTNLIVTMNGSSIVSVVAAYNYAGNVLTLPITTLTATGVDTSISTSISNFSVSSSDGSAIDVLSVTTTGASSETEPITLLSVQHPLEPSLIAGTADLFAQSAIPVEALTTADSLVQVDGYQVSDVQPVSDASVQSPTYQATDALTARDSANYVNLLQAMEVQPIIDALLSTDSVLTWIDQAAISDAFASSANLVGADAVPISDRFAVVVALAPTEQIPVGDALLATDSVLTWIDALSVSDLFSMIQTISIEQSPAVVVALGRSGNVVAIGRNGKVVALGRSGSTSAQGR